MSKNFLFFGFGQVAKSFVDILYEKKETFNFITTSRESSQKKYFKNTEYKSFNLNEKSFDINYPLKWHQVGFRFKRVINEQ